MQTLREASEIAKSLIDRVESPYWIRALILGVFNSGYWSHSRNLTGAGCYSGSGIGLISVIWVVTVDHRLSNGVKIGIKTRIEIIGREIYAIQSAQPNKRSRSNNYLPLMPFFVGE